MSKTTHAFKLTILVSALSAVYGTAFAESETDDISFYTKPESSISVGVGHQSGDRAQFGIYDGVMDDKTLLLLDADIKMRDDATGIWKTLSVTKLGLDNREIKAGMEQQGNWGISLGYNQMVRDMPYIINTGVDGFGTTEQTRNTVTPGAGPHNYRLGTERDILSLDFFKYLSPAWSVKVNYRHEEREGNLIGGAYGNGAISWNFLGVPIDSTTQQLEATLNYTGDKLQIIAGYFGSLYNNKNELTCYRISIADTCWGADPDPVYTSQPLDNAAHQAFVSGVYSFTQTTKGTFKVAYTEATADGRIPTASIAGISKTGSPPSSLDNGISTTLVQLGLTARPMPKLSLLANFRYYDVQDDTPVYLATSAPMHTTPQSYKTTSGKVEGTYNLAQGYNLIAGIDYSEQDRSLQDPAYFNERYAPYRAELDETTYRIQLRKSLSETLNGSLAYLYSDRTGSDYAPARTNSNYIAPLHTADRERNKIRLTMDWAPTEALGVQLNVETAKDEYGHTAIRPYGVQEGEAHLISLDVSYQINDSWQITGWYSHGRNKIYQESVGPSAVGIKTANQEDTGNAVGLKLTGKLNPKTRVGADLSWSRDKSEISQTWTSGSVTQVPDITSTATHIKLFGEYALKKNADLRIDLIHERWKTDDWTWFYSNGDPFAYGTTADGTTVITDPKQSATFLGVRYIYKFQ